MSNHAAPPAPRTHAGAPGALEVPSDPLACFRGLVRGLVVALSIGLMFWATTVAAAWWIGVVDRGAGGLLDPPVPELARKNHVERPGRIP